MQTNGRSRVLVVDDEPGFLRLLVSVLASRDLDVLTATTGGEALDVLAAEPVDVVITDVLMPDMSGNELFSRIRDSYPDVPVILITAYGSTEEAIGAVKHGAFHYFEKPLPDSLDLFWITIREALAKRRMLAEIAALKHEKRRSTAVFGAILGQSSEIRKVLAAVQDVAPLPSTVLIQGETGTGKELVARAIHDLSDRRDQPFYPVNCTEFNQGVFESELFGHEKGAFTGAVQQRKGLLEMVHRGTLFWDEISETPYAFQAKLLRVFETRTFMRVGGTKPIHSDFRIIAATNRDLVAEVEAGRFRKDLYFRLNVYTITIPPLRARREDIPTIADYYVRKFAQSMHKNIEGISNEALLALMNHEWEGNVREMVNVIEGAVISCRGDTITTRDLFRDQWSGKDEPSELNLKEVERSFIAMVLRRTGNNKTRAAEVLGIARKTLIEKIRLYGLEE